MQQTSLDGIALFIRVVEAGSFTEAARQLRVPTSTVSRAVARLESSLDARLVHRTGRKLTLSEAGKTLFTQSAPHVAGLQTLAASVREDKEQPRGTLRITAPVGLGGSVLGELVMRFAAQFPQLQLEFDLSNRLVDIAQEGFDVALRASEKLKDDAHLVARRIAETQIGLFASPVYLARRGIPRTPEELASHDCLLYRAHEGSARWSLEGLSGKRTVEVKGRVSGSDISFLRSAAKAGAGIAPLPTEDPREDLEEGKLIRVLPDYAQRSGTLYVVYPKTKHLPKKVVVFRDFVLKMLPPLVSSRFSMT